ncbi:GTPase and tRNA-U34 5-formylation enzyme TrmE [Clostridiaceae bacterium JG1575]|nr:GTPase and tRNA-U34 5-formylation enzyme TrmE [Clostridiaceae bacterium JG1575]
MATNENQKNIQEGTTIAGIASSGTMSSISVIRISGPESLKAVESLFQGKNDRSLNDIRPFTLRYGHMLSPEGRVIDEVLVSYFRAPRSYTGEEVVEISCHGGPLPVRRILEALLTRGIALAEPGEFTKRAFLNGRVDLSQAEAVMEIISARTDAALRSANDQSRGTLSERIRSLRDQLMNVMAKIEVTLDFPDDDLERATDRALGVELQGVRDSVEELLASAERGKILREGLHVVIAGKPNVGKSSLLNALLEQQRAIVTDIPGTTRDVIEEFLNLDGIPLRLSDTAGIRTTEDLVESIGVEKSKESLERADLIILVLDLSRPLTHEDLDLLDMTQHRRRILLLNKGDLPQVAQISQEIKEEATVISARNHYGLDQLRARIHEFAGSNAAGSEEAVVSLTRHKEALERAKQSLEEALEAQKAAVPMDLVTIDVQRAWGFLGEITGDTLQDDLVDRIFSGFCIGK